MFYFRSSSCHRLYPAPPVHRHLPKAWKRGQVLSWIPASCRSSSACKSLRGSPCICPWIMKLTVEDRPCLHEVYIKFAYCKDLPRSAGTLRNCSEIVEFRARGPAKLGVSTTWAINPGHEQPFHLREKTLSGVPHCDRGGPNSPVPPQPVQEAALPEGLEETYLSTLRSLRTSRQPSPFLTGL